MTYYTTLVEAVSTLFGGKDGQKPVTEDLSSAEPEQFASRVMSLLSG